MKQREERFLSSLKANVNQTFVIVIKKKKVPMKLSLPRNPYGPISKRFFYVNILYTVFVIIINVIKKIAGMLK